MTSPDNNRIDRNTNQLDIEENQLQKLLVRANLGSYIAYYLHHEKHLLSHLSLSLYHLFDLCHNRQIPQDKIDEITEIVESLRRYHETYSSLCQLHQRASNTITLDWSINIAIHNLYGAFANQDIELSVDIDTECRKAKVSEHHMEIILLNLLSNAFNALKSNKSHNKHVSLTTMKCEEGIQIDVIDNGCGIDPKIRQQIWDIGFSYMSNGLGIGLPIVKKIVDLYGGKIWEDGTPGKGGSFHVVFPDLCEEAK